MQNSQVPTYQMFKSMRPRQPPKIDKNLKLMHNERANSLNAVKLNN